MGLSWRNDKKFIIAIMVIIVGSILGIALMAMGLISNYLEARENLTSSIFTVVEDNNRFEVVYDNDTKVMYSVSDYSNGSGVFTLLVDEKGNPKLWKGE